MNKKGFTLIELLIVIGIISLISAVGILSYKTFFDRSKEKYYENIESNIKLAGSDYFLDHRDLLPYDDGVGEVSLGDLIDNNYLEPVKDSNGNICRNGKVYAVRENNKYSYKVELHCEE